MGARIAGSDKSALGKWAMFEIDSKIFIIILVLSSIPLHLIMFRHNINTLEEGEPKKELPYAEDHEEFLQLVNPHYDDDLLHEWEPAPQTDDLDPEEPGYMGKPVTLSPEKQKDAEERESENYFNVVISEMLSPNRTVPDLRVPECRQMSYPEKLPQTSVVIVFRNEAWSTLIRTMWSVYRKSPRALLKEIILVDDKSDMAHLQQRLEDYVKTMPVKTLLVRTLRRTGLIQARLLGIKHAKAPTVIFLDAHCECNSGWLEPLLARIAENRQVAIAPTIDLISPKTFAVDARDSKMLYSAFSWSLTFKWGPIPDSEMDRYIYDQTANVRTPAMAGGLFAIDREFFYKSGAYDPKMKIWGAENIEMSIRLWSCGGAIETAQCSRVSHIFRERSPHTFPGGSNKVVFSNQARLVDVWLDEWSEYFYSLSPYAINYRSDVTDRLKLRKDLKCKSFRWYLENIFPTSIFLKGNPLSLTSIQNIGDEGMCIDTYGRDHEGSVEKEKCHFGGGNQVFMLTEAHEIRVDDLCLDASTTEAPIILYRCHGEKGNQKWVYNNETMAFHHSDGKNCLSIIEKSIKLAQCDGTDAQKWKLSPVQKIEQDSL